MATAAILESKLVTFDVIFCMEAIDRHLQQKFHLDRPITYKVTGDFRFS
jgi:hypothetical protein